MFQIKRNLFRTFVVAAAAALVISVPVFAQDSTPEATAESKLPNIVLVHGAWADASSWNAVIQRLQAQGYNVSAPQLPLTSLNDDVARVREVLALQTGPTLLVAHSFGGAVITALGSDAPNVKGLLYESAFAPDKGESMKGIITGSPQQPSA
ncbi:MAG TPA: alpha/beta hydrolase, partial [Phototrophicaceae bacterium]|nr:alpha/beta hydrolase [Phototrophicaceae bacterium]